MISFYLKLGSGKALFSLLPVDDLPHLVQEHRTLVLVVHVVCMLPDVHVDDGHEVGADFANHVMVSSSHEIEFLSPLVVDKPSPATA